MKVAFRVAWTIVTFVVVEVLVCGTAALPVVLLWALLVARFDSPAARLAAVAVAMAPSYILFALCLGTLFGASPIWTDMTPDVKQ